MSNSADRPGTAKPYSGRIHPSLLLLLWLTLASALAFENCAFAQDEPEVSADRAASVELWFDWPVDLPIDVTSAWRNRARIGQWTRASGGGSEYGLQVESHTHGVAVTPVPPLDAAGIAVDPEPDSPVQGLQRRKQLELSFIVGASGQLVRAEGFAELAEFLHEHVLGPMLQLRSQVMPEAEPTRYQDLLDEGFSLSAFLVDAAEQTWDQMAGFWSGRSLAQGEVYFFETDEAVPLIPSLSLHFQHGFSLAGFKPCTLSSRKASCVSLKRLSHAEAPRKLVEKLVEEFEGWVEFYDVTLEIESHLLTEVETLLPHRLEVTEIVQGRLEAEGQEPRDFSEENRMVLEYRYPESLGPGSSADGPDPCARIRRISGIASQLYRDCLAKHDGKR